MAEGGMRWCLKMACTDQHGRTESCVAKVFKPDKDDDVEACDSAPLVSEARRSLRAWPLCLRCDT